MGAGGHASREDDAFPNARRPLPAMAFVRICASVLLTGLALVQQDADASPIAILVAVAVVHLGWSTPVLLRGPSPAAMLVTRVLDLALVAATVPFCGSGSATYGIAAIVAAYLSAPLAPHGDRGAVRLGFTLAVSGTLVVTEGARGDWESVASYALASSLLALIAATVLRVQDARRERLRAVADERAALLGDSAELAEADRRALSQLLHDRVLQNLLAAGQDLDEAISQHGDAQAEDVRHARELLRASVVALRDTVSQVHPAALAGKRLPDALTALVARHREQDGLDIELEVEPEATGLHDEELYAVAREMLANVATRPREGTVHVRLWREGERSYVQVVRRGGAARPPSQLGDTAMATVGLAWASEWLRRAGGGVRVELTPDGPAAPLAWAPVSAPPSTTAGVGARVAPTGSLVD